jgi:glycine cleavage system H protein
MQGDDEVWRVGLTKFAARMLGDVVDIGFEAASGVEVQLGDAVGWFEGFKARSDLYTVVSGTFVRGNPELEEDIDAVDRDRYGRGWLYEVRGMPDPAACDAAGYAAILDATIDRMRGKTQEQR